MRRPKFVPDRLCSIPTCMEPAVEEGRCAGHQPPQTNARTYRVRLEREIRCSAEVEVLADDEDHALAVALALADAPRSGCWQEDIVIDQTHRVREVK